MRDCPNETEIWNEGASYGTGKCLSTLWPWQGHAWVPGYKTPHHLASASRQAYQEGWPEYKVTEQNDYPPGQRVQTTLTQITMRIHDGQG